MLKRSAPTQVDYALPPRKAVKLSHGSDEHYDQFKGDCLEEADNNPIEAGQGADIKFNNYQEELQRNENIFRTVKEGRIVRSKAVKGKGKVEESLKVEEAPKSLEQPELAKKSKPKKPTPTGTSNWSQFQGSSINKTTKLRVVGLDCEFVRSGDEEMLARISIVDEKGSELMDSYVRPDKKITDYVTSVSGITYAHIRNAPSQTEVIKKAKQVLYNKTIVGHTVWKDLKVCGLEGWKGAKKIIDISEFAPYKYPNGKLISLKNLSSKFLGRNIQDDRHSSLEDAAATVALFNLKKKEILRQFKVIV